MPALRRCQTKSSAVVAVEAQKVASRRHVVAVEGKKVVIWRRLLEAAEGATASKKVKGRRWHHVGAARCRIRDARNKACIG
jgi:hypothetical protein